MKYRYYPYSCERIERGLRKELRDVDDIREQNVRIVFRQLKHTSPRTLERDVVTSRLAGHLLWMLRHLQTFQGRTMQSSAKRGRWIGWVYAYCEWLGIFTQTQVRTMARRDMEAGQV